MTTQTAVFPSEATVDTVPLPDDMIPMAIPEAASVVVDRARALAARVGGHVLEMSHGRTPHPDDADKIAAELDFGAADMAGVEAHKLAMRALLFSPPLSALGMLREYASPSDGADQGIMESFPWGITYASDAPFHDTGPLTYALGLQATDDAARRFLSEALEELDALDNAAAEMEVDPPAPEVKRAARRILMALAREFPRYYAVTLGDERDISIETDAGMGKGRGVLIVCDDEDVACYVTANGENTMRHYSHAEADMLPDEFIRSALRSLDTE